MATLTELAKVVAAKAEYVSKIFTDAGLPEPTLAESGKDDFDMKKNPYIDHESLRVARNKLINASQDLARVTMGPVDHIISIGWAVHDVANIGAVAALKIPEKIPLGGSKSLDDLVKGIGLQKDVVERTMRYAISNGIFCEPEPNVFTHSAASANWAENPYVQSFMRMAGAEVPSCVVKIPEFVLALQEQGDKAPDAPFNIAYPDYVNVFEYFGKNPEAAHRYFTYLDGRSRLPRWSIDHIHNAWDWKSVGGSSGNTVLALARKLKSARFVSQDISEEALKQGETSIAHDADLKSRVSFQKHNFFTDQPVTANAYIFRQILHDWKHDDCVKIIKALIPAMKSGSHVLINEVLLPSPPARTRSALDEKIVFMDDLTMMGAHNASERTLEEFQAIFKEASPDFKYVGASVGQNGASVSLLDWMYTG